MEWLRRVRGVTLTVAGREVLQGDLLADGGFAYVYRGADALSGEALAIRKALLQDADAVAAAHLEVALLRRLTPHPHVVRCLAAEVMSAEAAGQGVGARGQASVSLLELCTGGTLLARLEKAVEERASERGASLEPGSAARYCCPCLPEAEALDVLEACGSALAHLHGLGIIHYDVKSENLLRGADARWKLGDFGSASERTFDLAGASRKQLLAAEEFIHGRCTPIYRPPEAADVHLKWQIGPKLDIFAVGCVLFATLTGQHPFPIDSALGNIQAKFNLPTEASAAYGVALPHWVGHLLAREPGQRPSSATLLGEVACFRQTGTGPVVAAAPAPAAIPASLERAPSWEADFTMMPAPPLQIAQQLRPLALDLAPPAPKWEEGGFAASAGVAAGALEVAPEGSPKGPREGADVAPRRASDGVAASYAAETSQRAASQAEAAHAPASEAQEPTAAKGPPIHIERPPVAEGVTQRKTLAAESGAGIQSDAEPAVAPVAAAFEFMECPPFAPAVDGPAPTTPALRVTPALAAFGAPERMAPASSGPELGDALAASAPIAASLVAPAPASFAPELASADANRAPESPAPPSPAPPSPAPASPASPASRSPAPTLPAPASQAPESPLAPAVPVPRTPAPADTAPPAPALEAPTSVASPAASARSRASNHAAPAVVVTAAPKEAHWPPRRRWPWCCGRVKKRPLVCA